MLEREKKLVELCTRSMASALCLIAASELNGLFTVKDLVAEIGGSKEPLQAVQRALNRALLLGLITGRTRRELRLTGTPSEKLYKMSHEARDFLRRFTAYMPDFHQFYELDLTPTCWLVYKALEEKGKSSRRLLCKALYGDDSRITSVRHCMGKLHKAGLVSKGTNAYAKEYTVAEPSSMFA